MNRCIQSMMQEHELIIAVLASLHRMAEILTAGGQVTRQDVADFGRFFRDFADKCHHGKEEDRLFAKMMEHGFHRDMGPIAVMLAEHDAGRQEVKGLLQIGNGNGPLSHLERANVMEHASQFVPLLYGHIQKENNILYPMAQNAIPARQLESLDESCKAFDDAIQKDLDVSALRNLAASLCQRYPADSSILNSFGGCGACH